MTKVIVKRATPEDIEAVIQNIREADKQEIRAATGLSHDIVLRMVLERCDDVWTGFVDDDVVAIFGMHVISFVTGAAVPWLISTHNIEKHNKTFLRYCKPVFQKMCDNLNSLVNYVDDRNELAKQWLKWLGFTFSDKEIVVRGVKVLYFYKYIQGVYKDIQPILDDIGPVWITDLS